ncbi:MAG: LptA/OstA family protein [Magnetococcales bacterium]|nr:LptA/OstA family protein [Magnetococcales bacterium]
MPRMRWNFLVSLLLLTGGLLTRAGDAAPAQDKSAELVITSDRLEMDDKNRVALFSGHVLAIEKDMRLSADQMTVSYASPNKGDSRRVKVQEVQATGHVVLEQADYHGTADAAIYKMTARTVELIGKTGHVVVKQGDNRLEGERILLTLTPDRRLERMVVKSGGNRQVKAFLSTVPTETRSPTGGTSPATPTETRSPPGGASPATPTETRTTPGGSP